MTTIHAEFAGLSGIPTGSLLASPYRRTVIGDGIILVTQPPYSADLDGAGEVDLTFEVPEEVVAWMFVERIDGVDHVRPAVLVPTSGTVEYDDLTDVDPRSLAPVVTPDPLWEIALAELVEGLGDGSVAVQVSWDGVLDKPLLYNASQVDQIMAEEAQARTDADAGKASAAALTALSDDVDELSLDVEDLDEEVGDLSAAIAGLNASANVAWCESEAAADALPAGTLAIILDPL